MRTKTLLHLLSGRPPYRFGWRASSIWLAAPLLVMFAIPTAVHAVTTLSQGYFASSTISVGSIVSLDKNSTDHVSAATLTNVDGIMGVVINSENSLLSVSNGQNAQVQVATSGVVQVLVSDINGGIAEGDQITASPINGVGMKATDSVKVVGIAQDSLNTTNGGKQTYTDKSGQKHSVTIGDVPVLVNAAYYYKRPAKTLIPEAIQNIANALAGKPVNPLPILISMGIFLVTLIVVSSIVYSMIKNSIISVGRNPLSQSAVYRDLIQMSALVVGIIAIAVVSIYMILTRF
ncbi:MAG TPA: hypothetical protein VHD60_01185 [Candidatus Saccharimonadales bacterium]|nr:hypothetical protein [Candidatus Saccharimonadales bacterium]